MAFDECTPYPCDYNYAKDSMQMTHRWLDRCVEHHEKTPFEYNYRQFLFPIVQGSVYKDLRQESADYIASKGARAMPSEACLLVNRQPKCMQWHKWFANVCLRINLAILMGVGTPINILENIFWASICLIALCRPEMLEMVCCLLHKEP